MISSRLRISFGSLIGVSLVLATVVITACSSDSTSSTPTATDAATPEGGTAPTDGGTTPEAGADTGTPAGMCNTLDNGAPLVSEVAGVGAKPVPAGGAIVDGTYFLTKHEVFAPSTPDANTRKRTIKLSGTTFETHENDTGKPEKRLCGTFTTSGTNITFTVTSPMSMVATIPYTATATTYVTFSTDDDVFTGTKQ